RVAVLCQPTTQTLADAYASGLATSGVRSRGYTLPDGEAAKTFTTVEDVIGRLAEDGFTRGDAIIAVGGGALTDAAGFIAATFMRGVDVIYLPTTLLGAVDAAIGGKTAVNVAGKNLAGAFRHPGAVLIDVDVLDRLPASLRAEGAAEAIKTGFIADMEIVREYEADPTTPDLEQVVNRCVAVKAAVVSDDFRESDRRAILNYGHTVGHAVETVVGLRHGSAVSVGMVAAGGAAEFAVGFTGNERQRTVLGSVGLPTDIDPDTPRQALMAQIAFDKKRDRTGLRMVLLEDFASPVVVPVDDATVAAAFTAIGLT
ncbi:MAG: 3-dehydroquinate synthase, partial [Acidimicrobiia bacterium]|nr:3-dehydroquinate synthase [Acidimicrobiia bacterium]